MNTSNSTYTTQNDLLLKNLMVFYKTEDNDNLDDMLRIITGESKISLRIVDWFATNYAKKYFTVYPINNEYSKGSSFPVNFHGGVYYIRRTKFRQAKTRQRGQPRLPGQRAAHPRTSCLRIAC